LPVPEWPPKAPASPQKCASSTNRRPGRVLNSRSLVAIEMRIRQCAGEPNRSIPMFSRRKVITAVVLLILFSAAIAALFARRELDFTTYFDPTGIWLPVLSSGVSGVVFIWVRNRNTYRTVRTAPKHVQSYSEVLGNATLRRHGCQCIEGILARSGAETSNTNARHARKEVHAARN
jgi:hypothetical protein